MSDNANTVSRFGRRVAVFAALCFLLATSSAFAQTDKLDAVLKHRARQLTGHSRVIVEFRDNPDVRAITDRGGRAGRAITGKPAQVADVDNRTLASMAADPRISRVVVDHDAFATLERTGATIGATIAREQFGLTGKDVGVAVIDSGVTSWHDDLYLSRSGLPGRAERVVHFKDFTGQTAPSVWLSDHASDDYGHGTHVAGIIAGSGFDSDGKRTGVAPGVSLVALKVLDGEGHGHISDVIAAIDYAIGLKEAYNIRVINLSVATGVFESYHTDPLAQAAKRAVDAGIVVVAAAGNLGVTKAGEAQFGGITSPANAPWVLTVGASSHQGTRQRSDDIVARFSSRGPSWIDFTAKPDIVAPGVGIESLADPHSTLYSAYSAHLLSGSGPTAFKPYLSLSGTSMAAPVVTGTIALMLEANPALTPNAVKAIIEYTAEVRDDESPLAQGAGLLNARGAIRMAQFFAKPHRGLKKAGDFIEGEWIPWSRHILWGNQRLTGGVLLPGSSAWSTEVPWGAATAAATPVVWGVKDDDNIVWSTKDDHSIVWSTADDDNIVWSTRYDDQIVWSTGSYQHTIWGSADDDNIVWSTGRPDSTVSSASDDDNIVWSTGHAENVVWGRDCGGADCRDIIWGARTIDGQIWGTAEDDDNIVWSTTADDGTMWSADDDNIVWSTGDPGSTVWSTGDDDNIVWSTGGPDGSVQGTSDDDNIVWSTGIPTALSGRSSAF